MKAGDVKVLVCESGRLEAAQRGEVVSPTCVGGERSPESVFCYLGAFGRRRDISAGFHPVSGSRSTPQQTQFCLSVFTSDETISLSLVLRLD